MMSNKKPAKKATAAQEQLKHLKALSKYMSNVAKGYIGRNRMYSLCVKGSVCKCFEFNLAVPNFAKSKSAFFAISSLRGICEDLIVLRFIGKLPPKDREALIVALSSQELATRSKHQDVFFTTIRPQQPVLRLA